MKTYILPKQIQVGLQKRSDTTFGLLGYATFNDEKGKLRKEKSWTNWKDPDLGIIEVDNSPRYGFRLSTTSKRSTDWFGSGRHVIRVTDPKGFCLEITPENLLELLHNTSVVNGVIQSKCVWIWHRGGNLALVNEGADLYYEAVKYTELSNKKFSKRDLNIGDTVLLADGSQGIWLGRHNVISHVNRYNIDKSACRTTVSSETYNVVAKDFIVSTKHGAMNIKSSHKIIDIVSKYKGPKQDALPELQAAYDKVNSLNWMLDLLDTSTYRGYSTTVLGHKVTVKVSHVIIKILDKSYKVSDVKKNLQISTMDITNKQVLASLNTLPNKKSRGSYSKLPFTNAITQLPDNKLKVGITSTLGLTDDNKINIYMIEQLIVDIKNNVIEHHCESRNYWNRIGQERAEDTHTFVQLRRNSFKMFCLTYNDLQIPIKF